MLGFSGVMVRVIVSVDLGFQWCNG
jgi:hypothetical protein